MVGSAAVRSVTGGGGGDFVSFPLYGPWGAWYPWSTGFGWNFGFMSYNPWRYGAARWYYGPYGYWYDPFTYDWDPYWSYPSRPSYEEKEPETMGSLRIKASPSTAKVYIDGALVGTVDEFNGLKSHLEIEGGRHVLELRAEGYATYTEEINVKVGPTQTIRAGRLKAKK